jgi:hypothetical protein
VLDHPQQYLYPSPEETDKGFWPAAAPSSGTGFSRRPPHPLVLASMEGLLEGDGPTTRPPAAAPPQRPPASASAPTRRAPPLPQAAAGAGARREQWKALSHPPPCRSPTSGRLPHRSPTSGRPWSREQGSQSPAMAAPEGARFGRRKCRRQSLPRGRTHGRIRFEWSNMGKKTMEHSSSIFSQWPVGLGQS